MVEDIKFITLAIHTNERALSLKRILETHNIPVRFERVVISDSGIVAGVRVKISENDLPHALKITESMESLSLPTFERMMSGSDGNILIPVDFKPHTMVACRIGFELAKKLSLHPVLLHAFATPYFNSNLTYDESFNGGLDPDLEEEFTEMEIGNSLRKESKLQMIDLRKKIEKEQTEGNMPQITFSTLLNEGVAEDVIREYCRMTPPSLVVMATRGKQKKGEDLVGSVTAEVLDTCKVPVFSIPETGLSESLDNIKKLVFFCNLDQHDIISVDTLMRMFDYPEVDVILVPVTDKIKDLKNKTDILKDYFNKTYPEAHFTSQIFPMKNFMVDFNNFESQAGVEMIIVPNKRRNIFARLLNPGIAHKLLFERDLPLLALPV